MSDRLKQLADSGVSIWLDDLSRDRLNSGHLADLIEQSSVRGVTTNPTIFAHALSDGEAYADQVSDLGQIEVGEMIRELTSTDVRNACDLFAAIYNDSDGYDGRVSIEVEPGLARDTQATVAQAAQLRQMVDRENVLIKIPATDEGLPAIQQTIAAGISVNVTLIFSIARYCQVMDAYLAGLEEAAAHGRDLTKIHSVGSLFVSRVDTEVDKRLDEVGTDEAKALRGKTGVANARLVYEAYQEVFSSDRFAALAAKGANLQRPLWASTGVKNPDYPDTLYVTELVAAGCVNTMPEKTLQAVADHGEITGDTIAQTFDESRRVLEGVAAVGVDLNDVFRVLEDEGVAKFAVSWDELVTSVTQAMNPANA